jgi:hypothetical protein
VNEPVPIGDAAGVQNRLLALLSHVETSDALRAESRRARREFFGAEQPGYVDAHDRAAMDAAAQRFTEWFLLERPSDVLGNPVLDTFGDPAGVDAPLAQSRVGLFLVESGGGDATVRDLDRGEALELRDAGPSLRPGDVLVGRLFPLADGAWVASAATALFAESPSLAVAYQRDARRLALGRRLTQAELERLVFQQWAASAHARPIESQAAVPLEHIEADLQRLLLEAGLDDEHSASSISAALRAADSSPGAVIGPLLDELAFDTDADLDRARELLVSLWNAQRRSAPSGAKPPVSGAMPRPPARATENTPPKPRAAFQERPGEHLGERLARRIEEGLAANENVEALFADVERLLGEKLEDEPDEDEGAGDVDDGDLGPLFREFAWELGLSAVDEHHLDEFLAAQRRAPVPRLNVEYLEAEDWLRWLTQIWLGAAPARRAEALRGAFDLATRFHDWLVETQAIDVRQLLVPARRMLLDAAERLQRAGLALGEPEARLLEPERVQLLRVLGHREDALDVENANDGSSCWVDAAREALAALEPGDLVLAVLEPAKKAAGDTAPRARLRGPVTVLPAGVEPLLG